MDRTLMDSSLAQTQRGVSTRRLSMGRGFHIQLRWKHVRKRVSRFWWALRKLKAQLAKNCLDLLPNGAVKLYENF